MFGRTAHLYDLIYEAQGKDYAAESSELHALIERRRPGAGTLLDVACGTGGHLRHLRRWYQVVGVDVDPWMLAEARRHLSDVRLEEGDMRTLELGSTFDVVVCLFSSIGYMRDVAELHAATASMARHLRPGGVLVLDGWVRPDAWVADATRVEVAANDDVKVARVSRSTRVGATTVLDMHHLVASADGIEYLVDRHELTLFAPEQYEEALVAAGLDAEVVDGPMPGRDRYVGSRRDP